MAPIGAELASLFPSLTSAELGALMADHHDLLLDIQSVSGFQHGGSFAAAGTTCTAPPAAAATWLTPARQQQPPTPRVVFSQRCLAVSPFAASAPTQPQPQMTELSASTDVLAWLAGWGRLAEQQGCAAPFGAPCGHDSLFPSYPSSSGAQHTHSSASGSQQTHLPSRGSQDGVAGGRVQKRRSLHAPRRTQQSSPNAAMGCGCPLQ